MGEDKFKCYFPRGFFPIGTRTLSKMNSLFIHLSIYSYIVRPIIHLTVILLAFALSQSFSRYEGEFSKDSVFMAFAGSGGKCVDSDHQGRVVM